MPRRGVRPEIVRLRLMPPATRTDPCPPTHGAVEAAPAVEFIRNFAAPWAKAKPPTRARLVQAGYEGVTVRGEEFVSVWLAAEAYAHRLALALPDGLVKTWHWRARQDSNLRPSAPEADALSAELQARDVHRRHWSGEPGLRA